MTQKEMVMVDEMKMVVLMMLWSMMNHGDGDGDGDGDVRDVVIPKHSSVCDSIRLLYL